MKGVVGVAGRAAGVEGARVGGVELGAGLDAGRGSGVGEGRARRRPPRRAGRLDGAGGFDGAVAHVADQHAFVGLAGGGEHVALLLAEKSARITCR